MVIPRTWIRKEVVFYLYWQTTRRMGQSRWIVDDQVRTKRTPSFPSHESIVPRNAQMQRRWTIIDTLLCRWGLRLKLFFAQLFLLISSVSSEQSQMCVRNTGFVKQERRDLICRTIWPLFVPTSSLMKPPTPSTDDPAQEDLLQMYQERVERPSQQNRVIKNCTDAGYLTTVEVGQYFMTKDTEEFSKFPNKWHVVSTLCQEMKNHLTRKVGFEGAPKLDPHWKSQPITYKVNMEWKLELNL